jgi:hypothetical protein
MKKIALFGATGRGKYALVDDIDFERVRNLRWHVSWDGYVVRKPIINGKQTRVWLHRLILDPPKGMEIDHVNGNKLDNRRLNIRVCTHQQNLRNRALPKTNTSGFKGVRWHKRDQLWYAQTHIGNKYVHFGSYKNLKDAVNAYDEGVKKHFGEFAKTNKEIYQGNGLSIDL